MQIDVQHIAKLAKLSIPEERVEDMTRQMAEILAMVENLPPLEGAGSLLDPLDTMPLRPDVVVPSYPREEILQNAPETSSGCFLVPHTVE